MIPKLLFVDNLDSYYRGCIRKKFQGLVSDIQFSNDFSNVAYKKLLPEVLVYRSWQELPEWVYENPRLRFIQRIGLVRRISELEQTKALGLQVSAIADYTHINLAEHIIMMILALKRKLVPSMAAMQRKPIAYLELNSTARGSSNINWLGIKNITSLDGCTVGIIGFGETGYQLALRLLPFRVNFCYHNRSEIGRLPEPIANSIKYSSLDELLIESDIVVLLTPRPADNRPTFKFEYFKLMRETALLIMVGRASVVDERAVQYALKNKLIAGLGIDVFWQEPLMPHHYLFTEENVIMSPHIGGGTESFKRTLDIVSQNLQSVNQGLPLVYDESIGL